MGEVILYKVEESRFIGGGSNRKGVQRVWKDQGGEQSGVVKKGRGSRMGGRELLGASYLKQERMTLVEVVGGKNLFERGLKGRAPWKNSEARVKTGEKKSVFRSLRRKFVRLGGEDDFLMGRIPFSCQGGSHPSPLVGEKRKGGSRKCLPRRNFSLRRIRF